MRFNGGPDPVSTGGFSGGAFSSRPDNDVKLDQTITVKQTLAKVIEFVVPVRSRELAMAA